MADSESTRRSLRQWPFCSAAAISMPGSQIASPSATARGWSALDQDICIRRRSDRASTVGCTRTILSEQPRLAEPDMLATLFGHADEVDELMEPILMRTSRRDVVRQAQDLRIPFTEVLAPSEVMADADGHHASRDFWQSTPHPRGGEYLASGPAVRFGETVWRDGAAPTLGESNRHLGTPEQRVRWRRAGVA